MDIRKAVFPIAGLGTRFLPATKASPKEMLAVVDKPLIQYAVEEAYAAGIRQMIFITGRAKRSVEDHFDVAYELEAELAASRKENLLTVLDSIKPKDMECVYIRQPKALGLGHAVLCAENVVGQEPFAVLLADDLMVGDPPVLRQMIEQFQEKKSSILAIQDIPRIHSNRYGIVDGISVHENLLEVQQIVEKPLPEAAPSTLGVAGRYILTPDIFHHIADLAYDTGHEIQLTDAIATLMQQEKVFAYKYRGVRYDCGSKLGFLQACVDLGESHDEVGEAFRAWLEARGR
ncbi:MAG: UTP--glucose-1-phosphate uridylyltransferase GalU [Gammaproteobacteria bacterium]|nr:UTP--glucose-1-phosphate uridylyltransferase GalU [Gammaproteobacteria bacterium]